MAKDNQTIPLLQVSESQAEKYKAQAAKCPTKFLYKALKIMNECDVNYRQSSNKRLLVELTLIRVAQITQPDDDDSVAGRSPKRLKSLFKKLIASAQQRTASQVAAAAPTTQQGGQPAVQGDAASGNAQTTGQSAAADNAAAQTQEGSSVPQRPRPAPVKLGNIGKSFANLRKGPESRHTKWSRS